MKTNEVFYLLKVLLIISYAVLHLLKVLLTISYAVLYLSKVLLMMTGELLIIQRDKLYNMVRKLIDKFENTNSTPTGLNSIDI